MSAMTKVPAPAGEWTEALTAAADGQITVQNLSTMGEVKVRIDASATTGDGANDAADVLYPREFRTYTVETGDVVLVRPVGDAAVNVNVRA